MRRSWVIGGVVAALLLAAVPERAGASSIDRETIRRVMARNIRRIYACWNRVVDRGAQPGEGRATVRFEIAPTGKVTSAAFEVDPVRSAPVTGCIVAVLRAMRFPTYVGPGPVVVRYPLWFPPDGATGD